MKKHLIFLSIFIFNSMLYASDAKQKSNQEEMILFLLSALNSRQTDFTIQGVNIPSLSLRLLTARIEPDDKSKSRKNTIVTTINPEKHRSVFSELDPAEVSKQLIESTHVSSYDLPDISEMLEILHCVKSGSIEKVKQQPGLIIKRKENT